MIGGFLDTSQWISPKLHQCVRQLMIYRASITLVMP